jgi:hypothetical protein
MVIYLHQIEGGASVFICVTAEAQGRSPIDRESRVETALQGSKLVDHGEINGIG